MKHRFARNIEVEAFLLLSVSLQNINFFVTKSLSQALLKYFQHAPYVTLSKYT